MYKSLSGHTFLFICDYWWLFVIIVVILVIYDYFMSIDNYLWLFVIICDYLWLFVIYGYYDHFYDYFYDYWSLLMIIDDYFILF